MVGYPLGLVNTSASFQRFVNECLREHVNIDATVCFDDFLAYTDGGEKGH